MKKELQELIHETKLKYKTTESITNLRNHLNESYLEHEFLNMKNSFERLILNLEHLASQESTNSKCFNNILNAPNKFSSSLMSLCLNISQILKEEPIIQITHQHNASQVIFLALFLKFSQPDKHVTIITTRRSFKNWQRYIIDAKSNDPQSELKSIMKEAKINLYFINSAYGESITHTNQILIFDLMNAEVLDYKPLLLSLKSYLSVPQKIIFYHSHVDDIEVDNVLGLLDLEFFSTEASQIYPIQISFIEKDAQIKQKLVEFLKEDANHAEKQDIIIFYKNQHPQNSTIKKYTHKLNQVLAQHQLQSNVQYICDKNEILQAGKNHVFVVQNSDQLIEWNYTYEDVFFVIDYGWNVSYRMMHEKNCYVEGLNKNCLRQKTRRLSFLGISKVGKYIYAEEQFSDTLSYIDRVKEIMSYSLRMVQLGLSDSLEIQNQRLKKCIEILTKNFIIKKDENGKLGIIDDEILKLNKLGADPIQAKIIKNCIQKEKQKQAKTLSNLVIMTLSIINTRGNLRQLRQNMSAHITVKPKGIWRKSGYLDSCLEILTKAEIIESGKNIKKSLSKRSTSKVEDEFIDEFGSLFFDEKDQPPPGRIRFEEMKMEDLLKEYLVNDRVFVQIRHNIDELRDLFDIEQTNVNFDQTLLNQVIQSISHFISESVAVFTGSRRLGYKYSNQVLGKNSIFPNLQCLMSQLNQTPQFVLIVRCTENQNKREIFMCNTVNLDSFMMIFGSLPAKKSDSLAENEIEFHGISSSIFKGLFKNNGIEMQKFQEELKCFVEPNEEMATITVYCLKEDGEKVKNAFEELINKIKEKFVNYNKIIHYLGNTNISLSNGGEVKEVIKDNYINKCYMNNLDVEVTQEDIQELVEGFFVLKSIEVLPPELGKYSKSAIIQFNSQKDYYRFYSYYNQIKYFDRTLDIKPITMNKTIETVEAENFIDFKWYVWRSHRKAIVVFKKEQNANEAFKTFQTQPLIDGNPAQFSMNKNKQVFFYPRITIDKLHQSIDEIFLEKAFAVYGEIENVQILKTPLKEPPNPEGNIEYILKETLEMPQNQEVNGRYKINPIQKHKNGLRKCRVLIKDMAHLNTLITKLNGIKGKIGQGRIYAQSMFIKPILVTYPSAIHLYEILLEQVLTKDPQRPNVHSTFKEYGRHRNYLILSSPFIRALDYVSSEFEKKLKPRQIKLTSLQKTIILSEVGISNLIDLEEKYACKLIVNTQKKILEVICKNKNINKITEEVNLRVQDKFFYRISLNSRSYKNLLKDKAKLDQIKAKYFLTILQIEEYSKTLIFEGSANHVQNALNYMMHLIESYSKSEEELINTEVCLICYEELNKPYRLQNCGHKFCFGCLGQCINSILGDISMFPIKCPHCMVELTIDDLETLIDAGSWPKLINMGVTQYVNKNTQIMSFCYTAGCKQINMLKLNSFKCDMCAVSYCTECKQNFHPGLTCQEAKEGGDALFKKYMQENGVRVCPNKDCKMPIVRTDGCYRVTCSRCNKSMCFKCPANKMIAYNDYNECYKHLNDQHGGYW